MILINLHFLEDFLNFKEGLHEDDNKSNMKVTNF